MPIPHAFHHRGARMGLLGLLAALMFVPSLYGAATMDFARDMFVALRLLDGRELPLTGPLLNGASLHLGPIWYYLLAALLALDGRSWLGTTLAISLFASMQVPLAYLAGKALRDRRTGLMWAALLLIPNWATFNALLPSHPQLAPPLMLAFVLCALRYARRAQRKYLVGMAVCFTLAMHAHPSSLALLWIGLTVCARALWRRECALRDLAIAAAVAVAPLLPSLYSDATHGFSDLGNANTYLTHTDFLANLARTGTLLVATMFGGLRYWLETMLAWPPTASRIVLALTVATVMSGAIGLFRSTLMRSTRGTALAAALAALAGTATIAAMRDVTPFYMAAPIYLLASGLLAVGLAALGGSIPAGAGRALLVAGIVVLAGCADRAVARWQTRGAWPFGFLPLIDVKREPGPHAPMLLMPAYAMGDSGRFLCSQSAPSMHGVYASHVVMNYEIEMRLACGRSDVLAGGSEAGRQHWLGLSRAMLAQLDLEPERRLGPLGIVPARPLAPGRSIAPHGEPSYPAYAPPPASKQESRTRVELAADEYLVISDIALMFADGYEIEVSIDGRKLAPEARDAVSAVYACDACAIDNRATVDLFLRSANLSALDVVVFRASRPPIH